MSVESRKRLFWVALYGIAMGWFEASVVVYLRLLYYPDGFAFPIKMIPMEVGWIELVREAATILMLIAVGILAGRSKIEKFAYFIYAFGIWDIVYYISLKLSLGWPQGLFTWDLLFLLPVPWIGPVIAPVLISIAMISACFLVVFLEDRGEVFSPPLHLWVAEIFCALIIIFSFAIDYKTAFTTGEPSRFRWELYLLGFLPGFLLFLWSWIKQAKKDG